MEKGHDPRHTQYALRLPIRVRGWGRLLRSALGAQHFPAVTGEAVTLAQSAEGAAGLASASGAFPREDLALDTLRGTGELRGEAQVSVHA